MTELQNTFHLNFHRQKFTQDSRGYNVWTRAECKQTIAASRIAILLCDVWDKHPFRGAVERLETMIPRMNAVVAAARTKGASIIHAPSDTMKFYADSPARVRAQSIPQIKPPPELDHEDPPLPFDAKKNGSDTGETDTTSNWSRQHPRIEIDEEQDLISDRGTEIYSLLQHRGIEWLLIMGVHTTMCILHRSFAIKQMVRWGVNIALIRDLTDAIYNPALPPYVSHDEGTLLAIGFIEKFWCPSVHSDDLVARS